MNYIMVSLLLPTASLARSEVSLADRHRCHHPRGRRHHADCKAYVVEPLTRSPYGTLADECFNVTWSGAIEALGRAEALGTTGDWLVLTGA